MYTLIYFSPTGNTYHLAKQLATELDITSTSVKALEFTKYEELRKDENLILMYSIHGFNAPRTVKRFVKGLPKGIYNNIHLISVGCNTTFLNDAVSLGLKKSLQKKDYNIIVDEVLAMPLTFVMKFPDDLISKLIKESSDRITEIASSIRNSVESIKKVKIRSKLVTTVGKAEDLAARLFGIELHANKNCDSCSICWNRCPENNIKPNKNMKPKFGLKCMLCMRCMYECPQNAITPYISKFIPHKSGYNIKNHLEEK